MLTALSMAAIPPAVAALCCAAAARRRGKILDIVATSVMLGTMIGQLIWPSTIPTVVWTGTLLLSAVSVALADRMLSRGPRSVTAAPRPSTRAEDSTRPAPRGHDRLHAALCLIVMAALTMVPSASMHADGMAEHAVGTGGIWLLVVGGMTLAMLALSVVTVHRALLRHRSALDALEAMLMAIMVVFMGVAMW